MSFTLRPYQEKMVQEARKALRTNQGVLMQAATGAGKTAIGANILGNAVRKERTCLFIVHRQELIEQSIEAFDLEKIPHGVVAAGYHPDLYQPVQICSIDTLKRRLHKIRFPDLVVYDECHHMAAAGWTAVYDYFAKAKHIGLSATPQRLDGKSLGRYFGHMVNGPPIAELIAEGYLVDYHAFAPTTPDLSEVHTKMGDFVQAEVVDAMSRSVITGDAIKHYFSHARGRRFILFAPSRQYSENMADAFRANGTMAVHVDGETDRTDRKRAMQGFRAGDITGLSNVGLFGEGVDVPAAEVLIDMAPTKSLTAVMQRWGRVLRPVYAPGFDLSTREGRLMAIAASSKPFAIILDHAGNIMRHGLPCEAREWSLADRKKKAKNVEEEEDVQTKQCPQCYHLHEPAPKCPLCGYEYPVKHRIVEHEDGELTEIDKEKMKQIRVKEFKNAKTLDELVLLGIQRRYKYPMEWAEKVIAERKEWKENINKSGYPTYQKSKSQWQ